MTQGEKANFVQAVEIRNCKIQFKVISDTEASVSVPPRLDAWEISNYPYSSLYMKVLEGSVHIISKYNKSVHFKVASHASTPKRLLALAIEP